MHEIHNLIIRLVSFRKVQILSSVNVFMLIGKAWEPCEDNGIHAPKNLGFSDPLNTGEPLEVAHCFF